MTRAQLDRKPAEVSAMFDKVADRYDLLNDVLSLGQDRYWRGMVARAVGARPGELVLDLAAGTGTSSRTFTRAGARCVACDFSLGMLRVGARQPAPSVRFVAGDALDLPFADGAFDAVTISFGLRNVADTGTALAEMRRVTRPGGRLVICEFSHLRPAALDALYAGYLSRALPAVAGRLSGNAEAYDYLAESIRDWPAQRELADRITAAGWSGVRWLNLSLGVVALHLARRPAA
jgi:demethylmenaquinone methyltransferase/2-methoxy-6-polyprenyl-1,4-benzoquinol methylase